MKHRDVLIVGVGSHLDVGLIAGHLSSKGVAIILVEAMSNPKVAQAALDQIRAQEEALKGLTESALQITARQLEVFQVDERASEPRSYPPPKSRSKQIPPRKIIATRARPA